ncbi:helix-turn-helix domain-containing protein [Streptomyces sp. NA13]|uniref:MmyB family transcriptional regulator n=1 Tax=Streptomyces sp. NA13 TaxID=2996051 RepID=UPI00226E312D|nr:helix-turn-helix domain-containing protein [Streptomyces sp. NA13]WAC99526.1 helix-turn-helix domain-containing protein [Streptomyces sp. NA13]
MDASGELAALLRAWRERLAPAEAGLTAHTARRTAGLRREEVAVRAGVSVDYVVRLEQGRAAAPSAQVCAALARALRLSDTEQEHLFRLAGHAMEGGRISRLVPASVRRLVERTEERPVAVFDAMWDLLLWNPLWAALMGDFSALREADRNLLWLHFTTTRTATSTSPAPRRRSTPRSSPTCAAARVVTPTTRGCTGSWSG